MDGSLLKKKVGPLPVYAWGAVLIGAVFVYRYRQSKAAASGVSDAASTATDVYDPGTVFSGTDAGTTGLLGDASQTDLSGLQNDVSLLYDLYGTLSTGAFTGGDSSGPAASPASSAPSAAVVATPTAPAPGVTPIADPTPDPPPDAAPTQTLTETSAGRTIGTVTVPVFPIGTPAATIYAAAGLNPSDPVTLMGPSSNLPPSDAITAVAAHPTPGIKTTNA